MRISALSANTTVHKLNPEKKNKTNPSFKEVYIDALVELGRAGLTSKNPARFRTSDALLINRIAQQYPNQDCFIRKGLHGLPRLEYRERPVRVQYYEPLLADIFRLDIDPNDKEYPSEPLILYPESELSRFIGVPSFISINPSLSFTIKAGYEVHKKLMEKKYKIQEQIGKNDFINLGDKNIVQLAHEEIKEIETAVTRYLMESAYSALTDKASGEQIYHENFPKLQTRLEAERQMDITTSSANLPDVVLQKNTREEADICTFATEKYPDYEENKKRIKELEKIMLKKGISLL